WRRSSVRPARRCTKNGCASIAFSLARRPESGSVAPVSSKIPLQDLQRFHRVVEPELLAAAKRVVESGRFILGPEVDAFELELAEHLAAPNVVGVSSGTDALVVSLLAAALPSGAEVVTTPFSFFATVSAIVRAGLRPVFCDLAKD